MHLAHLFLLALTACITAPCDPTDQRLLAEKNAALLAAYTEVVGPRFQLYSLIFMKKHECATILIDVEDFDRRYNDCNDFQTRERKYSFSENVKTFTTCYVCP